MAAMRAWTAPSAAGRAQRVLRSATRPAFQVFAANTDTGKTAVTAGLVQAALRRRRDTLYLKPLQTGYPTDSDARCVRAHTHQRTHQGRD
jgi:dethiobiotin synthetase